MIDEKECCGGEKCSESAEQGNTVQGVALQAEGTEQKSCTQDAGCQSDSADCTKDSTCTEAKSEVVAEPVAAS